MLSAEMFTQHANVNTKESLTRVMMSSYGIGIAKVKINLCIRTVSSGASLDCSCPTVYSIVSINFISGQRSWSDWMTIKCWDNDVISSCLFPKNKRKKKEKIPCLPWNILIPYHTCPNKFNKIIELPVYLSKIARWETFSNDTVFCSESTLFAQVLGKYSKCQFAGVLYNGVWTADAITPIFFFFFFFLFCFWNLVSRKNK